MLTKARFLSASKNAGKGLVLIALMLQLASCGYQLRGSAGQKQPTAEISQLGPLYIDTFENTNAVNNTGAFNNKPFYTLLRAKLRAASVTLTTEPNQSLYRLKVYGFKTQRHAVSYAKNGDIAEYRQQASLAFQLTDQHNFSAINATRLKAQEIIRSDQNNLAADHAKTTQLQRELAQKLVDQIYWALKTASIRHKAAQPYRIKTP